MFRARLSLLALPALLLAGCYHATVETGRVPSGVVIEQPWAHSFIGGLVPPSAVDAASRCPGGIARVDTQLSFLNLLVGGFTGGIYTPMSVRVACAANAGPGALLEVSDDPVATLQLAAEMSRETGEAVFVQF
jgi:hypothetical protein